MGQKFYLFEFSRFFFLLALFINSMRRKSLFMILRSEIRGVKQQRAIVPFISLFISLSLSNDSIGEIAKSRTRRTKNNNNNEKNTTAAAAKNLVVDFPLFFFPLNRCTLLGSSFNLLSTHFSQSNIEKVPHVCTSHPTNHTMGCVLVRSRTTTVATAIAIAAATGAASGAAAATATCCHSKIPVNLNAERS